MTLAATGGGNLGKCFLPPVSSDMSTPMAPGKHQPGRRWTWQHALRRAMDRVGTRWAQRGPDGVLDLLRDWRVAVVDLRTSAQGPGVHRRPSTHFSLPVSHDSRLG